MHKINVIPIHLPTRNGFELSNDEYIVLYAIWWAQTFDPSVKWDKWKLAHIARISISKLNVILLDMAHRGYLTLMKTDNIQVIGKLKESFNKLENIEKH